MTLFSASYIASFLALIVCAPADVLGQTAKPKDLTQISVEDLMNIQVSSVSKRNETMSQIASAVFVIDAENIRRSGARNIPDLLRTVPGVNVARITAHTWAITIRGFNERFARNVLVLIDGRSVYSPLFGGVAWDQQDVPLEDIERIEVIRGPGGTIWGANAVNGVINIITRSASDTKGGLLRAGGGSQQAADALLQFGGPVGAKGSYRIFGNYSSEANLQGSFAKYAADGWHTLHGGFRTDWALSARDSLTVQGDISTLSASQTVGSPISPDLQASGTHDDHVTLRAGNVLGRWKRTLADDSDISLQVYHDRYNRLDTGFREKRQTTDFDFNHHFRAGSRHDIVWGLGYRITGDDLDGSTGGNLIAYNPPKRTDSLFSIFLQDEIRLSSSLSLTLGSKLEHNSYTGLEYEPGAQLIWRLSDRHEVWLSAARAIRQPTRTDQGVFSKNPTLLPNGGSALLTLSGNPNEQAVSVRDLEIGYRVQISQRLSVDVATFFSSYRNILTVEPSAPFLSGDPVPLLVIPQHFENLEHARSFGGEISGTWSVTKRWKLSPSYSLIRIKAGLDPASQYVAASLSADATPKQQFQVRSEFNPTRNIEWDGSLLYISGLRGSQTTPAYTRLDTRIARRMGDSVEISLTGQNLLTPRHAEFPDSEGLVHSLVARSVFGKVTWRF